METLTIDAKEVIEWMRQRRKLNDQWVQKHKVLRSKISELRATVESLELSETRDFFSARKDDREGEINYLELLSLNELLLKSKEAEGRTLFGGYSSKSIKELQAIIKVFEKENIHVASLATELSQILSFEIPSAKKVLKSSDSQVSDLKYKISSYTSSINNARGSIVNLAQKYNKNFKISEEEVESFDVDNFLNEFVLLMPLKVKAFLSDLCKVDMPKVVDYYVRFSKVNNFQDIDPKDFDILEWLYTYGDTLVKDFEAQVPPDPNEKDQLYESLLTHNGFIRKELGNRPGQAASRVTRSDRG